MEEKQNEDDGEQKRVNKHIVFVDDEEELENFSASEYFDTPEELVARKHNRLTNKQLEEPVILAGGHLLKLDQEGDDSEDTTKAQRKAFKKLQKLQQKRMQELQERKERAAKIKILIQEKQLEKNIAVCCVINLCEYFCNFN